MIDAIAAAAGVPVADVRRAAMFAGNLGAVARVALTEGAGALARFAVALHRPVQPMLAQPADDVADAMARLGTAALEWKVDGARVQVHKSGDRIRVYTRSLNDVTDSVPEVVEALQRLAGARAGPRRRGGRARRRRRAAAVPADDAPFRPQARCRAHARRSAAGGLLLRLPAPRRHRADRPAGARTFRCAGRRSAAAAGDSAPDHRRPRCRAGLLCRCARARPRRGDGQGTRCAVRGRQPRRELAEGQAHAHARPRRARRRVGPRPSPRLVVEPASRRTRPGTAAG